MIKNPIFSFVIPVFNEQKKIIALLENLIQGSSHYTKEIIIIDSGSTDSTVSLILQFQKKHKDICLIQIPKNEFNRSKTRNFLVKKAKGKYICFCTGHAIPINNSYCKYFLEDFSRSSKVVAVYGEDIPYPDAPIVEKLEILCKMDSFNQLCDKNGVLVQDIQNPYIDFSNETKPHWYYLSNIFTCYRRSFLIKHPFPRAPYGEDVLLGKKIMELNLIKIYDRRCGVVHYHKFNFKEYIVRQKEDFKLRLHLMKYKEKINIFNKINKIVTMPISLIKKIQYMITLIFYYIVKLVVILQLQFETHS